mgnify:CR=1 FL=1
MLLPKDDSQEELNKFLQVLAKACTGSPTPKVKPSINKMEVKLRSDKTVWFSKSAICQK